MHSCLSPCGDDEATPANLAGMCALAGLDIAALTDHNTCGNCRAFCEAAQSYGILGICGMELTTEVAKAARMIRLKDGPDFFPMVMSAVAIGNVALIGIPGEPFTGIGRGLKEAEGWSLVLPTCITNGNQGYFPMKEAYDEGGYEAGSSPFRSGTAEKLIAEGCDLLGQLR